jgi:DNA-binding MarR family transcriptional regulator
LAGFRAGLTIACHRETKFYVIGPDSLSTPYPLPSSAEAFPSTGDRHSTPLSELFCELTFLAIRLKQRVDLPRAEHAVMDIIDRFGPITVPQISRERSTSRQNIQILIDRLEAEGRVELLGNPAHKRSALVRLTEKGRVSLREGAGARNDLLSELGSRLTESEVREAISALSKVRGALCAGQQIRNDEDGSRRKSPLKRAEPENLNPLGQTEPETEEFPINLL